MPYQFQTTNPRGDRTMRSGCKTETGLSVLGGALLGAAAMYVLDPDAGRRRRQRLVDVTGGALHTTGDALSHAWDRARDAGASLGDRASDVSSRVFDRADDLRHRAMDSGIV